MPEEKAKILIVEDDENLAEMLNEFFMVQGYEMLSVGQGKEVVKTCRSFHPDLVILDIRLPDIDGFEVARRLRSNGRTMDIPIIFLSEKRVRADRLRGLEMGADDYISKPFDMQELRLRVRNSLRHAEQSRLINPVTGLPEGALVDERLRECLSRKDWALLLVTIENLSGFREAYGFVASDDVLRAASLMIHNAVRGVGSSGDFVGQFGPTEFLLVTKPNYQSPLGERIQNRLVDSLDFFYPHIVRGKEAPSGSRLGVRVRKLPVDNWHYKSLEDLKTRILL